MNKTTIVISGSIAIDRIMHFGGRYKELVRPEKIDSLSISVLLDDLQDAYGGNGANIAYSLALLGESPVLLGSVGADASAYMEKLKQDGVDTSHVHHSQLPTATFNVITDADQNQVGGFYPGAMSDSDTLDLEPWKGQNPIVVVSAHDPKAMKRQVAQCKNLGLRLCYDIGQQVSNLPGEEMLEGIRAAEILILNDYEMGLLAEKTGMSINEIKQTVPLAITTLGKNGSDIEGAHVAQKLHVGVATPKQVADPTGAGDAFRAGFLYGYIRNWPLQQCAQLGAVCGTYAIETLGTQTHRFTVDEIKVRYKDTFDEELPALKQGGKELYDRLQN